MRKLGIAVGMRLALLGARPTDAALFELPFEGSIDVVGFGIGFDDLNGEDVDNPSFLSVWRIGSCLGRTAGSLRWEQRWEPSHRLTGPRGASKIYRRKQLGYMVAAGDGDVER